MSETAAVGRIVSRRAWVTSAVCAAGIALSLAVASYPSFRADVPSFALPVVQSIDACLQQISIGPGTADAGMVQRCYARSYSQAMLNEAEGRRVMVMTQVYEERVALWIVVWVTSFGVIFAGAQIGFAAWLAAVGRGPGPESTELAVERWKIVVRSSVVGISMLAISWVFFLTFAITMYPRAELASTDDAQRKEQSSQAAASSDSTVVPPGRKLRSVPASSTPGG